MKQLIKYELRKILRVRVWISLLACLAFTAFFFIENYPKGMNNILAVQQKNPELISAHEGPVQPDLYAKYKPALQELDAQFSGSPEEGREDLLFRQGYASAGKQSDMFKDYVNALQEKQALMETRGDQSQYSYKAVNQELDLLEQIEAPGFYVTRDWERLTYWTTGTPGSLFMGIILALALASIFSGEADFNMDALILSSKRGRRSFVRAKIGAGLLFTCAWITVFFVVSLLFSCLPFDFIGWNAPLNSVYMFLHSPYAVTQLQGFVIQYIITLLAGCALVLLIALMSASVKSSLTSLGLATALTILPLFTLPVIDKAIRFLPSRVMASNSLLESYRSYNIFGLPVPQLNLSLALMALFAATAILLLPRAYARRLKG